MFANFTDRLRRLRHLSRRLFGELDEIRQEVRALGAAEQRDRAAVRGLSEQVIASERDLARFCDETVRVVRAHRESQDQMLALMHGLRDTAAAQHREIQQLRETMGAQTVVLPSWFWEPDAAARVRRVLRLLRPHQVEGVAKIRHGRPHDGGYVMLDDIAGVPAAISAGINDDVSWDLEIAAGGIEVFQYDHTIAALPAEHRLFRFFPLRLGPVDLPGTVSLATLLRERLAAGQSDLLLKIDIEGDEWATLAATDASLLGECRQIMCEFHDLNRLADPQFAGQAEACLTRLIEAGFFVAHVHGNNCANLINVGNVAVPDTLEVLFANRLRYTALPSTEVFPTGIDMPNQAGRADLFLGSFTF